MSIFDTLTSAVSLVDIGASGGIHQRWKLLGDKLRVIGFEPDARAFERLPQSSSTIWLQTAVHADNQTRPLYITRGQTNVSFLKPNLSTIETLSLNPDGFAIERTVPVKCERLDDVLERMGLPADVLKLDTQGTELYILQGAEKTLRKTVFAVETEVMFVDVYEGQPLFTDVHRNLQNLGFCLMDYGNIGYFKGRHSVGRGAEKCMLVTADALYFRSFEHLDTWLRPGDTDALQRAMMICLVYGYVDYAIELCHSAARSALIASSEVAAFISHLDAVNHYSRLVPGFPGRKTLANALNIAARLLSKVDDVYWINQLGNSIRSFRW